MAHFNRRQFLNIESFVKIQKKTKQNNWDTLYKDYPRIHGYRDTKIPRKCTVIPTINRLWPLPSPSTPDSSLFRIFSLHPHPCFTKKLKCLKTKMHKTLKFWHYKALKNCIKNCIKNALPPAPLPNHFVIGLKFRVQLTVNLQTIEHVFSRWVL